MSAYQYAVELGTYDEVRIAAHLRIELDQLAASTAALWQLKLLSPGGAGKSPLPIDPKIAEAELTVSLERDIRQQQLTVARVQRQLHALESIYANGFQPTHSAEQDVLTLTDPADVRRALAAATRSCTREVLTLQPGGGRDPLVLREALDRDLAMIERGIAMRIIYNHTARANLATRMYVRDVTAAGAEVRTADEVFERMIIFDGATAFVPERRASTDQAPGAAVVTQPTVVGFLHRWYEHTWQSSQPFDGREVEYDQATDELRMTILRLMASGLKDDVIARRLGMATRTCRRHIATIMESLEASSRFQAGVRARDMGFLATEDPPDVDF